MKLPAKSPRTRPIAPEPSNRRARRSGHFAELCTRVSGILCGAGFGSHRFLKPVLAINEDPATKTEEISFGTAVNIAPIDEAQDDWIEVAPYGEHPNEKGTQILDRSAADDIVANNGTFMAKLGRLFRGIPIYRGHPYQRPDLWPDDTRYGRVNELRAGDRALEGKVAWNDLGTKNKEQGYWVYPSPGWNFKRLAGGKIKPFRLDHIGLTNNPNILESVPVTNAKPPSAKAAESQQTTNKGDHMPKWLITALVAANVLAKPVDGEEPKEEQVQTALNTLLAEKTTLATNVQTATTAQQTAETALNTARTEAKKFRELAINHELNIAINDGRLTAAERPGWATKFETDFDAAQKELKDKQPALNTKGLGLSPSGKDLSDASKRRVAYNARVDELFNSGCKSIDEVITRMRANPEDAALLAAMEPKQEKKAA